MASISPELVERIAALAHLHLTRDRCEFLCTAYTDMLKLLDLLEGAQIGATEPATGFTQKRPV